MGHILAVIMYAFIGLLVYGVVQMGIRSEMRKHPGSTYRVAIGFIRSAYIAGAFVYIVLLVLGVTVFRYY